MHEPQRVQRDAVPQAPPDSEFDAASRWEGALRALPLAAGAAGITLTLANRILSGVPALTTSGDWDLCPCWMLPRPVGMTAQWCRDAESNGTLRHVGCAVLCDTIDDTHMASNLCMPLSRFCRGWSQASAVSTVH